VLDAEATPPFDASATLMLAPPPLTPWVSAGLTDPALLASPL